jgi:hypothetical protein
MSPFVLLSLAHSLGGMPAQAPDVCDLLDLPTASALLGQPATRGQPSRPVPDEDSGGMVSYCTYLSGKSALIVSLVTFKSPAAARTATTKNLVEARMDDEDATITEEAGLGDRAFWAYTKEGSTWVVLKGENVVGIGLGGSVVKPPATNKAPLRAAMVKALAKL